MILPLSLVHSLLVVSLIATGSAVTIAADLQPVNVEGVVTEVGREGLMLRTDDGVDYTASLNPKRVYLKVNYLDIPEPSVSVSGHGLPQHVVSGVYVELEVDLTPRRESRHIIPALRIFSPTKETVFGCFGRREGGGVRAEPTPFAQVGEGKWRVVGQINSLRGNRVAIAVPNGNGLGMIHGTVANTPLVELDVADHRFARPGDRAVLTGFSPALPFVFATELRVKRGEQPHAIPPKREVVADVEPVRPPIKPEPSAGDREGEPSPPKRKPLTILKVN